MFRNYMITAFRNLMRYKQFTMINIFGLAIGFAACMLIMLFVRDEYSYDKGWAGADRVYQLNTHFTFPGTAPATSSRVTGRARDAIAVSFVDDVEAIARVNRMETVLRKDGAVFSEKVHWTDPELLDIFNLKPLAGDLNAALHDNASLAVSQSFAQKYFGSTDPIGQTLTLTVYDLQRDYRVAAVFADLPHNTSLEFSALAMIDEGDFAGQAWEFSDWFSANGWTYMKLKPGRDVAAFNARLKDFVDNNIEVPSWLMSGREAKASDFLGFVAQPLEDVWLHAIGQALMKTPGNSTQVFAFSAIAALILLVACINFVNLSTAKAVKRAREVALRKVLGAGRGQLIFQYLGESMLLVLASMLIGLVLVELVLPTFSAFLDRPLALDYLEVETLGAIIAFTAVVGMLAGLYPALVLSGFRPAKILKANKSAEVGGSQRLRQALVVFQFAISIGLMVATGVIYGQMYYATNMDLGYNKNGLVSLLNAGTGSAAPVRQTLKQEIARMPGVKSVTGVLSWPGGNADIGRQLSVPGHEGVSIGTQQIDHDFLKTYDLDLLAGRNYDRARQSDGMPSPAMLKDGRMPEGSVLLNKMALSKLGLGTPEQAVGKVVRMSYGTDDAGNEVFADLRVVGIVPDMLFHSPRGERQAEAYYLHDSNVRSLTIRFEGDPRQLVGRLGNLWSSLVPDVPFQYEFVEDMIAEQFLTERHLAGLMGTLALLAILIACLGLFGLASFTAERRTKEIGIRKVMGATVMDIVRLLVWQFSKPVVVANLVAWPLACWGMLRWLETFPYRMEAWYLVPLCVAAGVVTLLISWATVGGNAARVARAKPIDALRYE